MSVLARWIAALAVAFVAGWGSGVWAQSEAQLQECRALFEQGVATADPYLIIVGRTHSPPNQDALNTAIRHFDEAIALCPGHWPAMWFKGKALQSLGDQRAAFLAFRNAYQLQPLNPDVVNEMTIEAVNVGELDFALESTERALESFPNNLALRARRALVLLLKGRIDEAIAAADRALEIAPADPITSGIRSVAVDVREGRRRQPSSIQELMN